MQCAPHPHTYRGCHEGLPLLPSVCGHSSVKVHGEIPILHNQDAWCTPIYLLRTSHTLSLEADAVWLRLLTPMWGQRHMGL